MLVNDVVDTKAIALAATNDASNDIPYLDYSGSRKERNRDLI